MKEPYETLLGQYREHWLLWKYLQDDEPDWPGLAAEELVGALSTGEFLMLHAAYAFRGDDTFKLCDLGKLDYENRARVAHAIQLTLEGVGT